MGAAPDLPPDLHVELALIGIGAIGTGIILLLDIMRATGQLLAVDYQRFGPPENRGTYSIGGETKCALRPGRPNSRAPL